MVICILCTAMHACIEYALHIDNAQKAGGKLCFALSV